jgi:hypothetical protein
VWKSVPRRSESIRDKVIQYSETDASEWLLECYFKRERKDIDFRYV